MKLVYLTDHKILWSPNKERTKTMENLATHFAVLGAKDCVTGDKMAMRGAVALCFSAMASVNFDVESATGAALRSSAWAVGAKATLRNAGMSQQLAFEWVKQAANNAATVATYFAGVVARRDDYVKPSDMVQAAFRQAGDGITTKAQLFRVAMGKSADTLEKVKAEKMALDIYEIEDDAANAAAVCTDTMGDLDAPVNMKTPAPIAPPVALESLLDRARRNVTDMSQSELSTIAAYIAELMLGHAMAGDIMAIAANDTAIVQEEKKAKRKA